MYRIIKNVEIDFGARIKFLLGLREKTFFNPTNACKIISVFQYYEDSGDGEIYIDVNVEKHELELYKLGIWSNVKNKEIKKQCENREYETIYEEFSESQIIMFALTFKFKNGIIKLNEEQLVEFIKKISRWYDKFNIRRLIKDGYLEEYSAEDYITTLEKELKTLKMEK